MWVDRREATGYFTKLAALVAFACFVLNIVMLGQIFDITPSDMALLPWAAFALLLAYTSTCGCCRPPGSCASSPSSRRVPAPGVACTGSISASGPRISFRRRSRCSWYPNRRPHPVLGLRIDLPHLRHAALFLPMLVLANWGYVSYLELDSGLIEGFYQTLGFLGTAALIWYGSDAIGVTW